MNPLNINHIKAEKAREIKLRYKKLRKVTNFFRVFEIFLVIAVISRVSFQLPVAIFQIFDAYFHNISLFLVSPKFVFIVGNAIVITLFVNSRHFDAQCKNTRQLKPFTNSQKHAQYEYKKQATTSAEENTIMATIFSTPQHQVIKIYHRSQSEKMVKKEKMERSCCNTLRRSNTDIKRKKGCDVCCRKTVEGHYPEDHMSGDEFRRTIEDFIAKQQRFLREEEVEISAL